MEKLIDCHKELYMKKWMFLVCATILLIAFVLPLVLVNVWNVEFSKLGTYGDFFGSFNSLVSLLAFGGLIYTIQLQRKDLELQREELKLTREELKKQAAAQEKTAAEQAHQAELLAEQINKDIRPYINVFWAIKKGVPYLVIRNVGKSTCSDFRMSVPPYGVNTEINTIAKGFVRRINEFKLGLFPSKEEYAIPFFDELADTFIEGYIIDYRNRLIELRQKKVKMVVEISFQFKGRTECFKTTFDFGNTPLPLNDDAATIEIVRSLKQIKESIDGLKN